MAMANRINEDQRIERAIRSLMKLSDNRRCINCNNLGPQYVCTTFFTFVCTNCSGIHREFTHRVKSVSMAKFTAEEVNALQAGGNQRAKRLYFGGWDFQRHSFPDGSNLHKLRDFIKDVYVDRKYTGERNSALSEQDEESESRKVDTHCYRSRGSYDEGKYDRYLSERSSSFGKDDGRVKCYFDDIRNPRYSRENPRSGGHKRNPVRFEIVDDRFRDDGFGSRRFSLGDAVSQRSSPNCDKNTESSSSVVVRPLQEILGENIPTIRVGEISKENNGERDNRPARKQEPVRKNEISQSLIDFGAETEALDNLVVPQTQKSSSEANISLPSAGSAGKQDLSKAPKVKTLESLLFEVQEPSVQTANIIFGEPVGDLLSTSPKNDAPVVVASPAPTQHIPELVDSITTAKPSSNDDLLQVSSSSGTIVKDTHEWPFASVQQPLSSPSVAAGSNSLSPTETAVKLSPNNEAQLQPGFSPLARSNSGSSSISVEHHQNLSEEKESSNRKELPADLFTINTSYLPVAAPVSGWQTGPPRGIGFNYFPNTMSVPGFPYPAKSTNPFDISDERTQFPSVASLQEALPNALTGLIHTSSIGPYSSQTIGPQYSANAHVMPPQLPYIGSVFTPPCAYTGQQEHSNINPQPQGLGGFGGNGAAFGSVNNTVQQLAATYSASTTPNLSSMGGNPFG